MRCLFLKPVKGYAYFKGDTGELPDEVAADLVEKGLVTLYQGEEENTLPEGMPSRKILFDNGFKTVEDVKNAREALEEIKGIGKKMAGTIIEYCESYEG